VFARVCPARAPRRKTPLYAAPSRRWPHLQAQRPSQRAAQPNRADMAEAHALSCSTGIASPPATAPTDAPPLRALTLEDILDAVAPRRQCPPSRRPCREPALAARPQRGAARVGLLDFQDARSRSPPTISCRSSHDARRDVRETARDAATALPRGLPGQEAQAFLPPCRAVGPAQPADPRGLRAAVARRDGKTGYVAPDPARLGARPLMLFAAGFGTRMGALTAQRPKPLIPVAGRALIDRALELAADAGLRSGGGEPALPRPADRRPSGGSPVHLSWERGLILETGGGLRQALPLLGSGPVATLNPDASGPGRTR
jgi:hypothetical protein